MVVVAFLTQFMVTGFVFYSFAVILTHLADEFSGGDRTPILALQLGMGVAGIFMAPIIGRLAGQGWIRTLIGAGTVATGIGMILVARLDSLWWIGLVFATLLALGGNTMGGVTPTTLIVHWFDRRRATALGASQLGASLGGMVMAPVAAWLVSAQGWRGAWEILGIAMLCLAPLVWWLTVDRPEDRGQRPDGASVGGLGPELFAGLAAAPESARPVVLSTSRALREPNLWLIALATGISFMGTGALLNHIVAFGTDAGFSPERAALLASLVAGGAGLGKLVWGWLCDRMGESEALFASIVSQGIFLVGLTWVGSYSALAVVSLLTGIAIGGVLPLSSALMARAFGRARFGAMVGLMWPIAIPPQLAGPILAAWIRDTSGSYDIAFQLFAVLLVLALVLVRAVRLP
ncbi:MAG: MFS transporter, partial [Proteobacteria bacterium]|nr:MFS transporter [Pseudomonadota bacterium]